MQGHLLTEVAIGHFSGQHLGDEVLGQEQRGVGARQQGGRVLAFTGKAGSELADVADLCLVVDAPGSAPAQEIHQLAYHILCDLVERRFAETDS